MTRANHGARPGPISPNEMRVRLFRTATLIWSVVMAWLAFRPVAAIETGLPWDKANHAAAFVVLTVLAGLGWPRSPGIARVAILLAAGVMIELVQGLPQIGRDADVWDVVADGVGIAAGLVLLAWALKRASRLRE